MLTLPDPKHEAFATLRASGHDVASAYIHAGYSVKNVKTRARKLVRNPNIQARIEHLKTCLPRIAELHAHHCPTLLLMPETRHEMLAWLWQVMSGARLIKPAQMRAAGLYCRLQGWNLAKLFPQAQAQAIPGTPIPDAADKPPVPSSTLTEAEKTFLASSNHQNLAHERSPMPRSLENLARYQSALADLAHPNCRQDAFGRPVPDLISKSTSTPAPTPDSSAPSTTPSIPPSRSPNVPASSTNPIAPSPSLLPALSPSPPSILASTPSNNPSIHSPPAAPPDPSNNPTIQQSIHPLSPPHPNLLSLNALRRFHPQPRTFLSDLKRIPFQRALHNSSPCPCAPINRPTSFCREKWPVPQCGIPSAESRTEAPPHPSLLPAVEALMVALPL